MFGENVHVNECNIFLSLCLSYILMRMSNGKKTYLIVKQVSAYNIVLRN
jgi:hypothetical protein